MISAGLIGTLILCLWFGISIGVNLDWPEGVQYGVNFCIKSLMCDWMARQTVFSVILVVMYCVACNLPNNNVIISYFTLATYFPNSSLNSSVTIVSAAFTIKPSPFTKFSNTLLCRKSMFNLKLPLSFPWIFSIFLSCSGYSDNVSTSSVKLRTCSSALFLYASYLACNASNLFL